MRCTTCDYALWNLSARACPECGVAFKPSDFQFVPNAVRFCCPHCQQQYYGTTPQGHLIPRTFNCVKCGQRIDMDEMILQPAAGIQEARTLAHVVPWLERSRRGWLRGIWQTIGASFSGPERLMRALPAQSSAAEAWLYALCALALMVLTGVALPFGAMALYLLAIGDPDAWSMLQVAGWSMLIAPLAAMALAGIWGCLTHALLRLTGGAASGIGRTFQAIMYASGANVIVAVPCVGAFCSPYVSWIIWVILASIMLKSVQKVSGRRAAVCTAVPPLFAAAIVASAMIFAYLQMMRVVTGVRATAGAAARAFSSRADAMAMSQALTSYATGQGHWPPHGFQLVADGAVPAGLFVLWEIGHDESLVPVAGTTLDAAQHLPPNRMQMTAESAAAALPAGVIAHRLGDVVFTYHGIDRSSANPKLWMAVISPDPDQSSDAAIDRFAICIDSTVVRISGDIQGHLDQQNSIRADANLPLLPNPDLIHHDAPAASSDSSTATTQPH